MTEYTTPRTVKFWCCNCGDKVYVTCDIESIHISEFSAEAEEQQLICRYLDSLNEVGCEECGSHGDITLIGPWTVDSD